MVGTQCYAGVGDGLWMGALELTLFGVFFIFFLSDRQYPYTKGVHIQQGLLPSPLAPKYITDVHMDLGYVTTGAHMYICTYMLLQVSLYVSRGVHLHLGMISQVPILGITLMSPMVDGKSLPLPQSQAYVSELTLAASLLPKQRFLPI